jgi:hypothetical protein
MEVEDSSDTGMEDRRTDAPNLFSYVLSMPDIIQCMFERFIVDYAKEFKGKDALPSSMVFYEAFRSIVLLTKKTSRFICDNTDCETFWLALHNACYNMHDHLKGAFADLSFHPTYMKDIASLPKEKLKTNLLDVVLGDTTGLEKKHSMAVMLSLRNAIQLPVSFVPVVYGRDSRSVTTIRRAKDDDPPSIVAYVRREDFDMLMKATNELETKKRLSGHSRSMK